MRYLWQTALIVPADARDAANALAPTITGGDVQADTRTYSIALAPTGSGANDPATHYACCTAVDAAMLAMMQDLRATEALLGVRYYRWEVATGALVATSSATAAIGALWGWRESLEDCGLAALSLPLPTNPAEAP